MGSRKGEKGVGEGGYCGKEKDMRKDAHEKKEKEAGVKEKGGWGSE